MAGIKFIKEKNYVLINYITNELVKPENRKFLFDDGYGWSEISGLLYSPTTVIYGVFTEGKPEPDAVVFFGGLIPYRDCVLFACVFDEGKRAKGLVSGEMAKIKEDVLKRFYVHSVTSYTIGENKHSEHMLKKLGFKKIGVKEKAIFNEGQYKDLNIWYILLQESKKQEV